MLASVCVCVCVWMSACNVKSMRERERERERRASLCEHLFRALGMAKRTKVRDKRNNSLSKENGDLYNNCYYSCNRILPTTISHRDQVALCDTFKGVKRTNDALREGCKQCTQIGLLCVLCVCLCVRTARDNKNME